MGIFVIFRVANPAALEAALAKVFPDDHLVVNPGQYMVSAKGSAKDVSDHLDISGGVAGPAMVFKMANYYGRATSDIWDWVKVKAEQSDG